MAIATDAFSTATPAPGTTLTWSHTTSGSNRILFAAVRVSSDSSGVTGVTYNAVAMTQLATGTMNDGSLLYLYYLAGPATGAHNIVASFGATAFNADGLGGSYTDAKQTGIPDSSNTGTSAASVTFSLSTTVVAANCWQVFITSNAAYTNTTSAGTGSTIRVGGSATAAEDLTFFDSNATVPTGSQSMQATTGGSTPTWVGITASFAPTGGAVAASHRMTLLGVG